MEARVVSGWVTFLNFLLEQHACTAQVWRVKYSTSTRLVQFPKTTLRPPPADALLRRKHLAVAEGHGTEEAILPSPTDISKEEVK